MTDLFSVTDRLAFVTGSSRGLGRSLARALRVAGAVEPVFVEDIAEMPDAIRRVAQDRDVVLTMGAGSIGNVPAQLT